MLENTSYISFQETPRHYRTEIPNIVYQLLEEGQISTNDFILYCVYRRIAGQHGACWAGTRKLEKMCKIKDKTIAKSKKNLSRPFKLLNGKPLIMITPCDRVKGIADTVTITDIWPENHASFQKTNTCSKREGTPPAQKYNNSTNFKKELRVVNGGAGGVVNGGAQEETLVKKNKIIAKPPNAAPPDEPHSQVNAARGNNNEVKKIYESLSACKDLSDSQKRKLMRYPEELVKDAVRYVYHPTTEVQGGPLGRLKLLQYFLKQPEDFAETLENLDNPILAESRKVTESPKERLVSQFVHGQMYNGFEFSKDNIGVGFLKPGQVHNYSVAWKSNTFRDEWFALLKKLGIELEEKPEKEPVKGDIAAENKTFAEIFQSLYNLDRLKIHKNYCHDTLTGHEFYYHLPKATFETALQRLLTGR
jgi:hypothetical protein